MAETGQDVAAETAYEWTDGTTVYQRTCDAEGCDKGLIYAPVRFCPVCRGDGKLLRFTAEPWSPR